jgi:hypothetical protein
MAVDSYERSQLWKEHTHPIILRQSALKAVLDICKMQNVELDLQHVMLLTERFYTYFETGNNDFIPAAQKFLDKNKKVPL